MADAPAKWKHDDRDAIGCRAYGGGETPLMALRHFGIGSFPRAADRPIEEPEYSFCETLAAHRIHIRRLSSIGRRTTGGADTNTLCGLKACWDLKQWTLDNPRLCPKCVGAWRAKTADATDAVCGKRRPKA